MLKKKVLVVDDTEPNRLLLGTVLASLGLSVVYAEDAADAMTTFRTEHPDVVFMDQILPDGKGSDLIRRMKRHRPELIAVLTTALAEPSSIERLMTDSGAEAFLPRPFTAVEVERVLRDHSVIG